VSEPAARPRALGRVALRRARPARDQDAVFDRLAARLLHALQALADALPEPRAS
jgi:hypothetical protein